MSAQRDVPTHGVSKATARASRVLVIGALGFIGSHVALRAGSDGREVLGLYRRGSEPSDARRALLAEAVAHVRAATLDTSSDLAAEIAAFRPDVVVHAAGSTSRDPAAWEEVLGANLVSTASLVAAIASLPETHRPALVVPGSQAEYGALPMPWKEYRWGQPNTAYGASKLAATDLVLAMQRSGMIRAGVLRLPVVFGPAQDLTMFIPQLIVSALAGRDFDMTAGKQRRRLIYVQDAAAVMLAVGDLAVTNDHPQLLNAPATEPMPLLSIANRVLDLMDARIELNVGAVAYSAQEQLETWPDTALAESLGLYLRTDLDDALRATIDWYRRSGNV